MVSLVADRSVKSVRTPVSLREAAAVDPLPLLLVRRGPVAMRGLAALQEDPRVELFVADELTPEWISFAQRASGALVATEDDPLRALGYAITAGMTAPVVIAMAKRYKGESKDLIAAGAIACVTMPIVKADVERLIPLLMRRAAPSRVDTTLRLLLDPISRMVRFRDKRVRLSQREFAVLHCLSSHGGRPVSAEDLLTYVWGDAEETEVSRQILDVYIFQLRKKLNRIALKGAIATVRGFGYMLVEVAGER